METATFLSFLLIVGAVLLTPGPSVALGMVHGMTYGAHRAAFTAAGDISANFLQMLAAVAGLGIILAQSATLFMAVKLAGIAYLVWLAIVMLRRSFRTASVSRLASIEKATPKPALWHYRQGFIVAATSPKAVLFYGALFPQYISPEFDMLPQFMLLALTCMLLDFAIICGYAALAEQGMQRSGLDGSKWIDRIGGTMMLGAAAALARSQR